jgi:hypothetical protein
MIQLQENENDERGLNVMLLPPQLFDHYWPELEQLLDIQPELWNEGLTKQNILDQVHSTEIQVWVVFKGRVIRLVFFTRRYVAPNGVATLQIFWMYGTGLTEVMYLLDDTIDKFAAILDCQRLEVTGRKGLERLLAPLGAEYKFSTFSRPVRKVREN